MWNLTVDRFHSVSYYMITFEKSFFLYRILWQIKLSFSIRHSDSIDIQEMDFEIIFEVPFFWASAFIQLLLCSTNIFTGYRPLGIFCCFNSVIIFKPAQWNNFLTNSSGLVTELSSSSISTSENKRKFVKSWNLKLHFGIWPDYFNFIRLTKFRFRLALINWLCVQFTKIKLVKWQRWSYWKST